MHSVLVLDLDGTAAPIGRPASARTVKLLKKLERKGYRIVFSSGKPTFYLCGFVRQLGLQEPVLIGENGCTLQLGIDLPPSKNLLLPLEKEIRAHLALLKQKILEACEETVWFQPNEVSLTPFPRTKAAFGKIESILSENPDLLGGLTVYKQCDCFDILPENATKRRGLELLSSLLDIPSSAFIAVGDGINDLPMFDFADCAIGLGQTPLQSTDLLFETVEQALLHILEHDL